LRAGKYPQNGEWSENTSTVAYLYRGDEVTEIQGERGNYAHFYAQVASAIQQGTPWPVTTDEALAVAAIIEQARRTSIR